MLKVIWFFFPSNEYLQIYTYNIHSQKIFDFIYFTTFIFLHLSFYKHSVILHNNKQHLKTFICLKIYINYISCDRIARDLLKILIIKAILYNVTVVKFRTNQFHNENISNRVYICKKGQFLDIYTTENKLLLYVERSFLCLFYNNIMPKQYRLKGDHII